MDCELGFLHPTVPWNHGQIPLCSLFEGTERHSLPPWLELGPAASLADSLQFRILILVQISCPKRSSLSQMAKKSSFGAEITPKNSLPPGDPRQGESQSYFHSPQPALLPRALKVPSNYDCTHDQFLREGPQAALVHSIKSRIITKRLKEPASIVLSVTG